MNTAKKNNYAKIRFSAAMAVFGTIGIFVRYINMPSALIAMVRGYVGFLFLLLLMTLAKKPLEKDSMRRNFWRLAFSGALIGVNWILLFEAYRYTTVAVATLCYYMQPVFLTLASPLALKEKLSPKKLACVLAAVFGMTFVSGVWNGTSGGAAGIWGIILGLLAAGFYTGVILMNKTLTKMDASQQTMVQLLFAAVAATPYVLLRVRPGEMTLTVHGILLLLFVGAFHTGLAYVLYFSQLSAIPAQSAAILGYIDPVVAIILSAVLLREPLGMMELAGAVLILGSAFISEWSG